MNEEKSGSVRSRAASLALGTAFVLTFAKLGVAKLTHSVGLLSEGIHSALDLLSALAAFYTIREAAKPADAEHPFGHGKFETLSSLLESLLLIVAALFIFAEGYAHWKDPEPLENGSWAIVTILFSLVASFLVYRQNSKAAELTDSSAIRVNALHFLADGVTSFGVLVALIAIELTGWRWIDPLIALFIGVYIVAISWRQILGALSELADSGLPAEEIERVQKLLTRLQPRAIEAHELRTRKSGAHRHFEFHLLVCGKLSVNESHELCDEAEAAILAEFPRSQINIHVEPCSHTERVTDFPCPRANDGVCVYRKERA